ncbi:DMT family transporter [Betaproteobacteria bacterium PRO7]|nr:DMT family transporter [Betaproteobacteria bacterium PRO7]
MSTTAPTSHAAPAAGAFTTGLLLAIAGAVLFSAKAILVKLSYRYGVDAVTLIALRMAFSVPFFAFALWFASRGAPRLSGGEHARLVLIGLLGYYAASFLDFLGLQYVTAALERLILYLTPTIVLVISAVWLRKAITRLDAIALALSYGGIVLAFWHDVSFAGSNVALGAALVFGSAVCYALYLVLSGELVRRVGAIRLVAYAMCVASTACIVQFLLVNPLASLAQPAPVYWLTAANAVFSTVIPVFATMLAVARIGAGNAALAGTVGPVATILLGYLFLGEAISGWQLAGTVLVLAGVFVLSRKGAPRARSAPAD